MSFESILAEFPGELGGLTWEIKTSELSLTFVQGLQSPLVIKEKFARQNSAFCEALYYE